jgi:hypothetical protein
MTHAPAARGAVSLLDERVRGECDDCLAVDRRARAPDRSLRFGLLGRRIPEARRLRMAGAVEISTTVTSLIRVEAHPVKESV